MNFDPGRDMAIPHMFDSNTPFVIVTAGAELSFLGKSDAGQGCEEEKESLVQAIAPHLSRVMQQGTAKHVGAPEAPGGSEEDPSVSILAQAEREDFQEFSPTNTRSLYSRSLPLKKRRSLSRETGFSSCSEDEDEDEEVRVQLLHFHLQRKQRRKSWRQLQEDGDEPPVIRGLWVQEIDWLKSASSAHVIPPPPQFKDSSCAEDASGPEDQVQDAAGSDSDCSLELDSVCTQEESDSDSSRAADDDDDDAGTSNMTFDLMQVSGFNSHAGWDSGSTGCVQSPLGRRCVLGFGDLSDAETVLKELRGRVTHVPKLYAASFLRDAIRRTLSEWTSSSGPNEGLLFHQQLEPSSSSQYREEEEYSVLHHIQNGSYGDVFCVRDKRTGFHCAAKKIPLSRFSSEEVQTWSALDSPRVVELFGAVREGPSVVLFMDLKPACLAQLLRRMNSLPEDLALHYLHQTLGALEHLHHRKVLHLDVKVDNVLLSADCTDTFLCDFGLSQTLDASGRSSEAFRGAPFPGTETHMAPEVARGDGLCPKADVWSSCCMLLHMLNGCPPWTRCYSHPLCLQIVNEPPPLWEVPSHCNHFTAKVFRAGLQKDPDRRASAKELRRKTTKALRAVGGLSSWSVKEASEKLFHGEDQDEDSSSSSSSSSSVPAPEARAEASAPAMYWVSPWRTTAVEEDSDESEAETDSVVRDWDSDPKPLQVNSDWDRWSGSEVDIYMGEEEYREGKWLKTDGDYEGDWEEEGEEEEEEEEEDWDSSGSTEHLRALRGLFPLLQRGRPTDATSWGSEPELKYLRDDLALGTTVQTPSPEPRDDPPSCFSCSDSSQIDASDKDSDRSSDDLSSGVFSSCNSQTDGQLTEWAVSANQPSSYCFEGVDIWIENVQGECLRIRERRQVKVGHVAIGISDQVCGSSFTLETLDRKTLPFEQEVRESSLWLRCVPAPDRCQRWSWRVRDGKLELRE